MNPSPISLDQWQAEAQWLDFQGHKIATWSAGEGPPLLLIHGFPSAAWDWSWIWQELAAHHRVIACDLLGFGFSAKPVMNYSLYQQAELQLALLASMDVHTCAILTHDYGVSVAQELLARQNAGQLPLAIERICFLNGGMFPGQHRPRLIQHLGAGPLGPLISAMLTRGQFGRSFSAVFGPDTQPSERELDDYWRLLCHNRGHRLVHRLLRYMHERNEQRERWVDALLQARIPLKHINGAVDPVSGEHVYRHWLQRLPQSEAVLLPGVGHYPQCEAPELVLTETLAFTSGR